MNKVTPSKTQNCVSFYTKKYDNSIKTDIVDQENRKRMQKPAASSTPLILVLDMTTINKQTSKQTIKTTAIPKL